MNAAAKSNLKKNAGNMTEGSILGCLLTFAFPILIGNIFQQLYNVVDTAVVGNVLGDNALASIGAAAPIYSLVVSFANGITNGFAVIIARAFGADKEDEIRKSVALTFVLTAVLSVIFMAGSLLLLNPLLNFLETPATIIKETKQYLFIILAFSVATMFYNMFAGMLRAIGNSRAPLYFLVIAMIINVLLDIILVKYTPLGVAGAACATVIAQLMSVVLCIVYIYKKCPMFIFRPKDVVWDGRLIGELLSTGLSMGLMIVVVSIGSVALQRAVNSLGEQTIAAHTAARKIDDIFMLPLGTITMAASTFTSQNFGAGKMERVKKGIITSILIDFVWSAFACLCSVFGSGLMVQLLSGTKDPVVLNCATNYIRINLPFFFVLSILLVLRSSLQSVGRKLIPVIGSIVELIAKFLAVIVIVPMFGYMGVCFLEPVIWILSAMLVCVEYVRFVRANRQFCCDEEKSKTKPRTVSSL
ncbi:MAG: MATE family efflux transporter [Lachnospiraceae bacterium]|nr:MATE family efflux transporter [Lachnospiraceae bacterium]